MEKCEICFVAEEELRVNGTATCIKYAKDVLKVYPMYSEIKKAKEKAKLISKFFS